MNACDYFFEHSGNLEKDFVLGPVGNLSFRQLHDDVNRLSAALVQKAGSGSNIILIGSNSSFFITAYLAILKSGNVAVPLNPEIEQSNLDFIQEKCQACIVIMHKRLKEKLGVQGASVWDEQAVAAILTGPNPVVNSISGTRPEQLAEIVFTSGSTGEPKGVMITHGNLIANTESIVGYLELTGEDIMLVVLPFYYCYGLSLLHTHLRVGGSIVLNNMFIMLGGVIRDLLRFRCTGFAGVPSHFQILLRKSDSFRSTRFPDLRYVTQAGGKLHVTFIREFMEAFPEIPFYVMYGQTEATARLAWLPPAMLPDKIGSCGKAIPGVELIIAGEDGNPVKPGEAGEVLARGGNIMAGYYRDPDATGHTLVNGWLHTGDLAVMDEDGYIYLTARKKEIIKVGGRRVSPKEIEEVIVSIPTVIDCRIEGVYDDILGETLKATVVVREGDNPDQILTADTIRSICGSRLASYKIPQIIEIKDKVTISATGKIVRR